jgi:hypothetical protein
MNQAGLGERVLNSITVIYTVGIDFIHGILNHLNIYQASRYTTTCRTVIDSDLVNNDEVATQIHPVQSVTETMNQAGAGKRVLNLVTVIDIVGIEFVHGILNHLNIYQAFRFTTTCRAVREFGNDKILNGPEMLYRTVALSIAHHVYNRCTDAFPCRVTEGVKRIIRPYEDNKTGHTIIVETLNNEVLLYVNLYVDPSLRDIMECPVDIRFHVNRDLVRDFHHVAMFNVIPTSFKEGTIGTYNDHVALSGTSPQYGNWGLKNFQYTDGVIDILQQFGVI